MRSRAAEKLYINLLRHDNVPQNVIRQRWNKSIRIWKFDFVMIVEGKLKAKAARTMKKKKCGVWFFRFSGYRYLFTSVQRIIDAIKIFGIRLYTLFAVLSWWTLSFQLDLNNCIWWFLLWENVLFLWKFWLGIRYSDRLDVYHIYCTEIKKSSDLEE